MSGRDESDEFDRLFPAAKLEDYLPDRDVDGKGRSEASPKFIFDGDSTAAAPQMLVKRLVPVDGICFVGGQSGAGKTFVEVHMATCLASGTAFFGFPVKERVGVAILAAEGAGGLQRRIDAEKTAFDIDSSLPIAWRGVADNLLVDVSLKQTIVDLKKLDEQLRDEHGVRLGAVFVDTIGAAFGIEDENDAAKVNAAMRSLRKIGGELGAVVIPVHHYGKSATTGLRGSSAFRGAADVVISVLAEREEVSGESSNRSICLAKARDGEEGPISSFELQWVHLGHDEDNEPYGSCVVERVEGVREAKKKPKHSPAGKVALNALNNAIGDLGAIPPASNHIPAGVKCATVEQWRDYAYRQGIADSDDASARRKAFQRARESLIAAGHVGVWEPYAWPT